MAQTAEIPLNSSNEYGRGVLDPAASFVDGQLSELYGR